MLCGGVKPEDSDLCWAPFMALDLNEKYTASVRTRNSEKRVSATVQMETVLESESHIMPCLCTHFYYITFSSISFFFELIYL